MCMYVYIYMYIDNENRLWLLHKVLFTTNLFRMTSNACHTRQVMIASDVVI